MSSNERKCIRLNSNVNNHLWHGSECGETFVTPFATLSRMKYDDSEYFFLNFETDLDNHAANTHSGMYLAWAVHAGLTRVDPTDESWTRAVAATQARQLTGANLLSDMCDGKLTDMEFNAEGNAFTAQYYEKDFHHDYARVFDSQIPSTGHDADDICSVPDTWGNFDLLKPVLDRRLAQWRAGGKPPELSLVGAPPAATPPAPAGPAPDMDALRRRAEGGDRDAWYDLAIEYITGAHVPRDYTQAANAFEKAAQLGIPEAAFNLGVCYQNGDGRPQDPKQRLRWFALAAEGGHGQAAYFLAMAYRQGDQVPQDFIASNALMLLAQRLGVEEARSAGVMAGSLAESMALSAQLSEPGQLVAVLSARRRKVLAGQLDTGVERFKNGPGAAVAPKADRPAGREAAPEPSTGGGFGLGHAALLIGAASFVLLLLAGVRGSRFVTLAWVLSIVGAGGVFAVAPSLGLRGTIRGVVTALAALPVLGGFVNLWLAVRWAGRRAG
jgi:Sel1 repeat